MLNSAKIIPALQRKYAISKNIRWGPGAPGPSCGFATLPLQGKQILVRELGSFEKPLVREIRILLQTGPSWDYQITILLPLI